MTSSKQVDIIIKSCSSDLGRAVRGVLSMSLTPLLSSCSSRVSPKIQSESADRCKGAACGSWALASAPGSSPQLGKRCFHTLKGLYRAFKGPLKAFALIFKVF